MGIQTITGTVLTAAGAPWISATIELQLDDGSGRISGLAVVGVTNEDGEFSVNVYNNSSDSSRCLVRLPDGNTFVFDLDPADETTDVGPVKASGGVEQPRLTPVTDFDIDALAALNGILTVPTSRSNVLVAGAGTAAASGVYEDKGVSNGQRFYTLTGTNPAVSAIAYTGTFGDDGQYGMLGADSSNLYVGATNPANLFTDPWAAVEGDSPAPTVTEVLTGRRALTNLPLGFPVKDLDDGFIRTLLVVGGEDTEANWKVEPKEWQGFVTLADPPTDTTSVNDLGSIVWSKEGTGTYSGTLAGAFPASTYCRPSLPFGTDPNSEAMVVFAGRSDANSITIKTYDKAGLSIDSNGAIDLQILVYP